MFRSLEHSHHEGERLVEVGLGEKHFAGALGRHRNTRHGNVDTARWLLRSRLFYQILKVTQRDRVCFKLPLSFHC